MKSVEEYLIHCREGKKLSIKTCEAYEKDLRQFKEWLDRTTENVDLRKVERKQIREYCLLLNQMYQVATVKRKMSSIKGFYTYLEKIEAIEESPARFVTCERKAPVRMVKRLSLEEVLKITRTAKEKCALVEDDYIGLRNTAIVELLFGTGLRVSELCSIEIGDYDKANNSIRIIGKGNKERFVYLGNGEVANVFCEYLRKRETRETAGCKVFTSRYGETLSTQTVRWIVAEYAKEAGIIQHVTPHMFRHSFATVMLENGANLRDVQELMGHSSITTTQIYLHPSKSHLQRVIETIHPFNKVI